MSNKKTKVQIQNELDLALAEINAFKAFKSQGVIDQLRRGFSSSWLAATVGGLLGAFVPVAVWWLVHHDLSEGVWKPALALVLGGLAFSAKTVYQWTREAFACGWKAAGFTLLIEGVLTFAESPWLSVVALGYLAVVNAAATASTLAAVDGGRK